MPETPNPETPAPAPDNSLQLAVEAANYRANEANIRAAIAEEAARRAESAARSLSQPPRVDPIDRLANEDVTLTPAERKNLLGAAITSRAQAIAGRAVEAIREENIRRDAALESRMAMERVIESRPELNKPEHAAKYAGAMTQAKFEFEAAQTPYTQAQLANRAAQLYDDQFRPKPPVPPTFEGSGGPNMNTLPQGSVIQQGKSFLEEKYGMKEGQIEGSFNPNDADGIRKMNNDYVNNRNAPLLKAGVVTSMQEILRGGDA